MKGNNTQGTGVIGVLQIVFITLKLTGNIDWSWLWVLSPILIPLSLVVVIGTLYGLVMIILIGLGVYTYEEVLKKLGQNEQK